jgi:hypothetical protein
MAAHKQGPDAAVKVQLVITYLSSSVMKLLPASFHQQAFEASNEMFQLLIGVDMHCSVLRMPPRDAFARHTILGNKLGSFVYNLANVMRRHDHANGLCLCLHNI